MTIQLPKKAACVFMFDVDRQLLCVTRRNTNIWSLPGGKVDPGETDVQAAIRETREETGFNLDEENLFPVFSEILQGSDGKDFLCTTFLFTRIMSNTNHMEPWMIEDGIKCAFLPVAELLKGAFSDYNTRVLENVNRIPFFKDFLNNPNVA